MIRWCVAALVALSLSGCAADRVWAPDAAVQAARYVHPGPTEIALVTSINNRSGSGAHTGLLINGSQRVLFDPAGNWADDRAPERHDVRFGMTPQMEANYFAFQSHGVYHAVVQRVSVTPEVAEMALELAKANGAVAPAMCTTATSALLRKLPGFEGLSSTMLPASLMESFAKVQGVRTEVMPGRPKPGEEDLPLRMNPVIGAALANRPSGS